MSLDLSQHTRYAMFDTLEDRRLLSVSPILQAVQADVYTDTFQFIPRADAFYIAVPADKTSYHVNVLAFDGSLTPKQIANDLEDAGRIQVVGGRLLVRSASTTLPWLTDGSGSAGALGEWPAGMSTFGLETIDLGDDTLVPGYEQLTLLRKGSFAAARTIKTWKVSIKYMRKLPSGRVVLFGREDLDPPPNSREVIYSSDGTVNGTFPTGHSVELVAGGQPFVAGRNVYFAGRDESNDRELWKTDGIYTSRVRDIHEGEFSSEPEIVGAIGDTLYFTAYDGSSHRLWRTDGSEAGTQPVTSFDVEIGVNSMGAGNLGVALGDHLLFPNRPDGRGGGQELWITDGTDAGTHQLRDIGSGGNSDNVGNFTPLNGRMYFSAGTQDGMQLWRTDGTSAGTVQLTSFAAGPFVTSLNAFNGAMYFCTVQTSFFDKTTTLYRYSDSAISVLGTAFNDTDADGAQDLKERGITNVRVYLDANNNRKFDATERSALTDAKGRYSITGLSKGKYYVRQVAPTGAWETTPSYLVNLVSGDHVSKHFGSITGKGLVSGRVTDNTVRAGGFSGFYVWADLDRDGKLDSNEPKAITDDTGRYVLGNLAAGSCVIRVVSRSGWTPTGSGLAKLTVRSVGTSTANFKQARL